MFRVELVGPVTDRPESPVRESGLTPGFRSGDRHPSGPRARRRTFPVGDPDAFGSGCGSGEASGRQSRSGIRVR